MSLSVDVAQISFFESLIYSLAQEDPTWFPGAVDSRPGVRGKKYYVERTQGTEAILISGRHQPTGFTEITHTRRFATPLDYGLSEAIDDIDEVKMIISPQSNYVRHFAAAYARQTALTCTVAMLGSASTENAAGTASTQALPSTQSIAAGGTGLTMAKLLNANYILDNNGVIRTNRHIAVSPKGIQKLLTDTQVTSADFNSLQALQGGTLANKYFMGMTWHVVSDAIGAGNVMTTSILPKSGNTRSCIVWQQNACRLYMARDFMTEAVRDPGIWNNLRIMVKFVQGAVRAEDEAVVKLDIDESV